MTFSLISVAVMFIAALVIIIEVVRAINRGLTKTLVTLASVFLAVFVSIIITNFVSDLVARPIVSILTSSINLSSISSKVPSLDNILFAYADSIISPMIFLLVFIIVRVIIAIVLAIVYKSNAKKAQDTLYEHEDAPQYKKKPRLINGFIGAFCGLMLMVIFISPAMGSLKIVSKAFKNMSTDTSFLKIKVNSEATEYFDKCSKDIVGNVIYYCGGNLIYRSVASSSLNENYFTLERELDQTFATSDDILNMGDVLGNLDSATEEEKNSLRNLGGNVDKAETLKAVAADVVPTLSKRWLNGEDYEGMSKPKISKACEPFFNKMLYVCKSSTPDTVGADLTTLLNVYLIAHANDILVSEDYKNMIEKAKFSDAFELIKKELSKNPRMAGISLETDNMTIRSIASALQSFNVENYEDLMNNLTSTLNTAMSLDGEKRLTYIADLTRGYINEYGIDAGDDVINNISERFVEEVIGGKDAVTVDDIKAFWDKYSVTENVDIPSSDNTNTPADTPDTEEPNPSDDVEEILPEEETTDGSGDEILETEPETQPGETVN